MAAATGIVAILLGLALVFFGRRIFWLFVFIGGFLLGWFLVPAIFPDAATWLALLIGVIVGIVFGLLAILFARVMVAIAGFFVFAGGAVLLIRFLGAEAPAGSAAYWVAYIIGGLVGAILLFVLFDWALIVITSLAGAWAVAGGIGSFVEGDPAWLHVILFVVLAAIGIAFQAWTFRAYPPSYGRGYGRRRAL